MRLARRRRKRKMMIRRARLTLLLGLSVLPCCRVLCRASCNERNVVVVLAFIQTMDSTQSQLDADVVWTICMASELLIGIIYYE